MENKEKEFSKIYDQYIEKIYRFVFLKVDSKETAQDLTAESFLRFWQALNKGNLKIENAPSFLYKIARNLVVDYYRKKGKNEVVSIEKIGSVEDARQNLEKLVTLNSEMEIIKKAILELNEDYQNVIIWYYLDDLSIEEVSKLCGRSIPATRVLISRAVKSLRETLKKCNKIPVFAS